MTNRFIGKPLPNQSMLENVQAVTTPLLRQIAGFGHWLALVIVIMSAATFVIGVLWHGHSPQEMFMVAVATSSIPEGLPTIMTITPALGMKRMARHNAIIRHLPAVETLGSVTMICSDINGTLTRNEMTLQRLATADRAFEIGGAGYSPEGGIRLIGEPATFEQYPELQQIARAAVLCNDAELHKNADGIWQIEGDPTEGALLAFAVKAGADLDWTRSNHPRADVITFESEQRLMVTLNRNQKGQAAIYAKGAPGAEVWLIHTFTLPFAGERHIVDHLDAEMQRYCAEARQHAYSRIGNLVQQTAGGRDCFVRLVEPGYPAAVILAKEAEFQADLIVMGKHGQSIVKQMLIGSVTRHMLADSKCDVLIVR